MKRYFPAGLTVATVLASIVLIIALLESEGSLKPHEEYTEPEKKPAPPKKIYGIDSDKFYVMKDEFKRNELISTVLKKNGVDYKTSRELIKKAKLFFDVRRIRSGKNYAFLLPRDTSINTKYFIFETSSVEFVGFELGDSIRVFTGEKDIDVRIATGAGIIKNSLWQSLMDNDCDPNLAHEIAEIFAWDIDFIGLKSESAYKVIYEELFVDGKKIGTGEVLAAWIHHDGHNHFGIQYKKDSTDYHYNESGVCLARSFLKLPLKFTKITSRFSHNRLHPVLRVRRPHYGIDYAAPIGTPVFSIGDGRVVGASYKGGAGRMIKIRHDDRFTSAYLHLSGYAKGLRKGKKVTKGQLIGYVGSSGLSTGPHLDFRIYEYGKPVNPEDVNFPELEPLSEKDMVNFNLQKERMIRLLNQIPIPDFEPIAMNNS